jgi:type VI secretion system protein ImpA
MPLRNDLLNPVSSAKPAGENLRYAPVYDKIKEARRQDDDLAQGEWVRERKVADWPLVIKLISESLATKSKDLQLVAWLAEAMLRREGVAGFREVLELAKAMLDKFWDDLYPELEEGDAELRAMPLQWIGDRLEIPVKQLGITKKGLNWYQYKESQKLGDEKSANNAEKKKEREAAIKAGKITLEVFDKDFDETPKKFYVDLLANFDATLDTLTELGEFGDSKFGGNSPTYGSLRNALDEVRQTTHILLQKKREKEPDAPPPPSLEEIAAAEVAAEAAAKAAEAAAAVAAAPPPPPPPPPPPTPVAAPSGGAAAAVAPAPVAAAPVQGIVAQPANVEDAVSRIMAVASYLREQDKTSPAPYLLAAGFRWGELRAKGANADPSLLASPSGEVRQNLKKLAMESKWAEVIDAAQAAAAAECGRGWLDVHRYIARACEKIGGSHQQLKQAVVSGVRALLADYPKLTEMTLMDDTPTANAETMEWLKEQVIPPPPPPAPPPPPPEPVIAPVRASSNGEPGAPDVFEIAQLAVKKGRPQEGIELLMREMTQERSGRGRFQRKSQLAQICVATGHQTIAFPILQDLAGEIERRKLEDWETPEMVAHPLALLYKCLAQDVSTEERQKLYSWICRLDPLQAMNVAK